MADATERIPPVQRKPFLAASGARFVVAVIGASEQQVPDAAVEAAIDAANVALPDYAQVRRWVRSPRPFSPADGTLTANGRLRRREISARMGALLDDLYREELAS
jgi:long-chain acyl-CoA synthetase